MTFRIFFILCLLSIVSVIRTIIQNENEETPAKSEHLDLKSGETLTPLEVQSETSESQQSELSVDSTPPEAQQKTLSKPEECDKQRKSAPPLEPRTKASSKFEKFKTEQTSDLSPEFHTKEIFDALYLFHDANAFRIMGYEDIKAEPYFYTVIVACPVDESFDDYSAGPLPEKTLFQREIYKYSANVDFFKCTKQYKPSLIYKEDGIFDSGYLVFYNTEYTLERDVNWHLPHAEGKELVTREWVDHIFQKKSKKIHPTEIFNSNLFWIPALSFKFDVFNRSLHYVIQTFYYYQKPIERMAPCNNFDLGKEIFRDTEITDLYSPKNQNNLFKNYQFVDDILEEFEHEITNHHEYKDGRQFQPKSTVSHSADTRNKSSTEEQSETETIHIIENKTKFEIPNYLINQPLAPTDDYQELGIRLATCTYLTHAPMWKTIVNGWWKRINDVIAHKAAHLYKLQIITGTHGVLQLPLKNSNIGKPIFLQQNLHPVPELFWKFLKYSLFSHNHTKIFHYFIIIVTHNYPNANVPFQMICPKDVCHLNGWPLTNEDFRTGRTYCCRVTKQLLQKLRIPGDHEGIDFSLKAVDMEMTNKLEIIRTDNFTMTEFIGNKKENLLDEQIQENEIESGTDDGKISDNGDTTDDGNSDEEGNQSLNYSHKEPTDDAEQQTKSQNVVVSVIEASTRNGTDSMN